MENTLPRRIRSLRNATMPDGSVTDITISDDTVTEVRPARAHYNDASTAEPDTLDLTGFMVLPAPAEPHAHLDKALTYDAIRPPVGDLPSAITRWRKYSTSMTTRSIAERARAQVLNMLSNGTTAIRSHVDILSGPEPLRGVKALISVRDELADLLDIEIVALGNHFASTADIEAALDLGVDLVGGSPHHALDPAADLDRLLDLAHRRGVGIDLHTDENLDAPPTLTRYAQEVRSWKTSGSFSASHCVHLGTLSETDLATTIREVLGAGIGIITLPITNLYLQGWNNPVSMPRGLPPLRALLDAGVPLAAGADNVQDPFNPVGRSDALETVSLLVTAGHLTLDEALNAVTVGARRIMHLPDAGPTIGAKAELLAIRGNHLNQAIANAATDRFVIHRGNLVAHSQTQRFLAEARPAVRS